MTPDKQQEYALQHIDRIAESSHPAVVTALEQIIAYAQEKKAQVLAQAEAMLQPSGDPS